MWMNRLVPMMFKMKLVSHYFSACLLISFASGLIDASYASTTELHPAKFLQAFFNLLSKESSGNTSFDSFIDDLLLSLLLRKENMSRACTYIIDLPLREEYSLTDCFEALQNNKYELTRCPPILILNLIFDEQGLLVNSYMMCVSNTVK